VRISAYGVRCTPLSGEPSFAEDSSLERNGLELSVPRQIGNGFAGWSELNRSTGTPVVQADLGIPIELSGGWSEEPSLTAQIKGRHKTAALSAVRAHRGTEGSNPFPSSGESTNHRFLAVSRRQRQRVVARPPDLVHRSGEVDRYGRNPQLELPAIGRNSG
jgi:hypothetical protein